MNRPRFREQVLQAREEAIVASVNRLLAEKGFDAMTVDEVVADVGIAKASLYKHFTSKEELAAAAMVKVLERALDEVARVGGLGLDALGRLQAMARWTYDQQLAGQMPALPAQNSTLRAALTADKAYVDRLMQLSDALGAWIVEAQGDGQLDAALPPELVLYTLFARACDPVLGVMRAGGNHSDGQIVDWLVKTCFRGLGA
ncbi:MAG: helix-turn-helix domain-containing protein [Roseateles sp.]|jgi:TetR/AcrR family transcriptional regulator of autoinduction and epiphytic fitness|nr:TetR family transcriptional regulator [Methylibium sp.]MBY0364870.1 TetR/AcrR family transcriptional regulator [Burkholderiaceae bacterium]RTL20870.1 MAG: TetR/AcrR family transcriptional regulator [Burkholderiales bacterium]|mmetsp:Transcript_961/g.1746  ORF Transcript_961/g.1746 Transcript_961/m.1746 type:complete len:201 (-) Transcript_961:22-624(-)